MILLDENIAELQRMQLQGMRISAKQIGVDFRVKGLSDDGILVLLREMRHVTFVTGDSDFYRRHLAHQRYCLLVVNAPEDEIAHYTRRFLRHPDFDTHAKRMGSVVRGGKGWAGCMATPARARVAFVVAALSTSGRMSTGSR